MKVKADAAGRLAGKTKYASPVLTDFGSVVMLTKSGSSTTAETASPGSGCALTKAKPCPPSDIRLKTHVSAISHGDNGLSLYLYRYDESLCTEMKPGWYAGYMAHEVAALYPEAVSTGANGYLQVDYSLIPKTQFH